MGEISPKCQRNGEQKLEQISWSSKKTLRMGTANSGHQLR